jgi:hypothetical protein
MKASKHAVILGLRFSIFQDVHRSYLNVPAGEIGPAETLVYIIEYEWQVHQQTPTVGIVVYRIRTYAPTGTTFMNK